MTDPLRAARPGDRVVVVVPPESGRLAEVIETKDGQRVFVRVIETNNRLWLGPDGWAWVRDAWDWTA